MTPRSRSAVIRSSCADIRSSSRRARAPAEASVVVEVCKRRAPPDIERLAQLVAGIRGRRSSSLCDELLEANEVELIRLNPEAISGRARLDAICAESLAQLRHVHLQRGLEPLPAATHATARRSVGRGTPLDSRCRARIASTARCRGPPTSSARPSCTTSSAPRIRNSIWRAASFSRSFRVVTSPTFSCFGSRVQKAAHGGHERRRREREDLGLHHR